jgi:glyoxylase-like metal-dependent hydrolase (beta-lactamase superfamily II)
VGGSVTVDNLLYGGESIPLDHGISLEVIHTPGHSAGSISLWCPTEKVLFTGDAVLVPEDMPIFDNYQSALDSLAILQDIELDWLLSAWDEPKQSAAARILFIDSADWLKKINAAVHNSAEILGVSDRMELCRTVVAELGLPQFAANPLVARSLMSCLAE